MRRMVGFAHCPSHPKESALTQLDDVLRVPPAKHRPKTKESRAKCVNPENKNCIFRAIPGIGTGLRVVEPVRRVGSTTLLSASLLSASLLRHGISTIGQRNKAACPDFHRSQSTKGLRNAQTKSLSLPYQWWAACKFLMKPQY